MASATDVFGIATLLCAGATGGGGPPTFSSASFGFSTVGGGGGTVELVGGNSIFGGSFTAASILGGSGRAAGAGCGGVGMAAGRLAMGCVVEGAAFGIWIRSRGCKAAISISLVILPLVGVGWVNSVSGSTSGVIRGRAFTGSGGDDKKSLGSSTIRTMPAMCSSTEARLATPDRPREAGSPHSVRRCSSTSSIKWWPYGFHPSTKVLETISECSLILSRIARAAPRVRRAVTPEDFGKFRDSSESRKASNCSLRGSPLVIGACSKPICRSPLTLKTARSWRA